MGSRERIKAIIGGRPADRCGLWLGNPEEAMWPIIHRYFKTSNADEFRRKLHDDFRWIMAPGHPDTSKKVGILADAVEVKAAEQFDLPDPAAE